MNVIKKGFLFGCWFSCLPILSYASGVQPLVSAIIIHEKEKEASIDIKNTEDKRVLLYTKINLLSDDNLDGGILQASPQAIVVGPNEVQTVRILYRNNHPISKEHIARVVFSGIPEKRGNTTGRVDFIIGQDLPVVIRPQSLAANNDKWSYLKWRQQDNQLCVTNPTQYVIRYNNAISLEPGKVALTMPKSYILPDQTSCQKLTATKNFSRVNFSAVSDFNYQLTEHNSPINQ